MPKPDDRPRVSATRIGIWVIAGVIGLYMVITGVAGALTSGG
ncbi:hypothetical protein [Microbacterium trichothecenolyticum]|nr:hypothetical protein [Microbacterium trichothecenolyticum]